MSNALIGAIILWLGGAALVGALYATFRVGRKMEASAIENARLRQEADKKEKADAYMRELEELDADDIRQRAAKWVRPIDKHD